MGEALSHVFCVTLVQTVPQEVARATRGDLTETVRGETESAQEGPRGEVHAGVSQNVTF